jgi:hypothetical protein
MTEIEIYTKIMEIVDAENIQEANVALEFVQRKIQNKMYAQQQVAQNYGNTIGCSQGLAGAQYDYQAKERERAYEEVRKIVREELASNPYTTEAA